MYWNGYDAGYIAPTDAKTYDALKTSGIVPANHERFHASAYSLENSLPVIKLGLTDHWQIDPEAGEYGWTTGARDSTAVARGVATMFEVSSRFAHLRCLVFGSDGSRGTGRAGAEGVGGEYG